MRLRSILMDGPPRPAYTGASTIMKTISTTFATMMLGASLALVGCDASNQDTAPAAPDAPAPVTPSAAETAPPADTDSAAKTAADQVKQLAADSSQAAKDSVAAATAKLTESLPTSTDGKLAELTKDLTEKVKSFSDTLTSDAPLKDKLQAAVESLSKGEDGESLGALQQIKQANLTPAQTQLVSEVQNVWSAVVVQKNFAGLSAGEGEVGNIVNALQGGDTATALTNLKQLAAKASLSPQQKELINKIVTQYAPGLGDAGAAAQESLKGLNPFDK